MCTVELINSNGDAQCEKMHILGKPTHRCVLVPERQRRKTTPMSRVRASGAREERKRVNRTGSELASRGLKGAVSRAGGKSFAATFVMHAG